MNAPTSTTLPASTHQLMFAGLFPTPRTLTFPCDARGHVDLDALPRRALQNYYFARSTVGRDYDVPVIVPAPLS
ncbi:MAG: hypothetical protein JO090_01170 [Rhizobacter sp.]|nr:hypothetical protein [Rhizobacter sp.]